MKGKYRYFFSYLYEGGNGMSQMTLDQKITCMDDLREVIKFIEKEDPNARKITIINWRLF